MKILQVVRQYLPSTGGMETYVSSLCRQLVERDHRTDVATLDYLFKTNEPLPHYSKAEGIDVIRLPSAGTARYFFAPRLMELVPRYDLIHVHGVDFFVDMLGSCKKLHGRPVVLSTHGGFFHTPWLPTFKLAYFHSVSRLALRGVDRVIASSPKDEALFSQVSRRVTLVENGIDYATFAKVVKQTGPAGETLVFIGRISRNKRVDRLLDTLALVRQQRPGVSLKVVGPDWEGLRAGLERRALDLGLSDAVEFTGVLPQDKMLDTLASASLFVSASEYEAFGLSTVEAMATGTVPVVNRIPAFEGLVDDAETGYLTDFSDPGTAAAAVLKALELPTGQLEKMGAAGRRASSRYDWNGVAEEIIHIYEEVLASHGSC
ncbi:MAG: glycosyltransferase family 4 protein [Thermoleophilia bacterium]